MGQDLRICRYQAGDQFLWDSFVRQARNGLFWFLRDYLDYYGERIRDHSLMFLTDNGEVIGALPANEDGSNLRSHGGLPFGGLMLSRSAGMEEISSMLDLLADYMREAGFDQLILTNMPTPYQQIEGDEVEYLLKERGAQSAGMRLTSVLRVTGAGIPELFPRSQCKKLRYSERRYPVDFSETDEVDEIWPMLENFMMRRFGSRPVHSLPEIRRLKSAFPANIRFLVGRSSGQLVGGQMVFILDQVARLQTSFRSEENRGDDFSMRLDLFSMEVLGKICPVWDFGTSYDPATGELQPSLFWHKERLGARGVAIRSWEWKV